MIKPPSEWLGCPWTLPQRHKLVTRAMWFKPSPGRCCDFLWGVRMWSILQEELLLASWATPGRYSYAGGKPGRPWFLFSFCRDPPCPAGMRVTAFSSVWLGGLWKAGGYFSEKSSSCYFFLFKYQKLRVCLTWSIEIACKFTRCFFCPTCVESESCSEWFAAGNAVWVFHKKEIGMN